MTTTLLPSTRYWRLVAYIGFLMAILFTISLYSGSLSQMSFERPADMEPQTGVALWVNSFSIFVSSGLTSNMILVYFLGLHHILLPDNDHPLLKQTTLIIIAGAYALQMFSVALLDFLIARILDSQVEDVRPYILLNDSITRFSYFLIGIILITFWRAMRYSRIFHTWIRWGTLLAALFLFLGSAIINPPDKPEPLAVTLLLALPIWAVIIAAHLLIREQAIKETLRQRTPTPATYE